MSQPPIQASKPSYRLFLLGSPLLQDHEGRALAGMGPGKPLAMLAYLVVNGTASREELVALFWPEMPEARARNAFRQTLHRLRGALGVEIIRSYPPGTVSAAGTADGGFLWCDVTEFRTAVSVDPERAITLYRGAFLNGLDVGSSQFEQWTEAIRDRLESQYRGALASAANRALESGNTAAAAEHAATLSRIAPLDPDAAVLEATILAGSGRRPEAISVLTQHSARIESELGGAPAARVRAMLNRLLNESPAVRPSPAALADQLVEAEFVGRGQELGRLLALWRGIEDAGAMAVITGPAGIGRTRLITEFAQRIQGTGPALVLWGQERSGNRAIPYAAIADALRPAANAPGIAGASRHLLAEASRLLPEIRDRFDLPPANPIGDDAARIRFFEGVAALLDAVAYEQPVCFILDDVHHSSRSSVALVDFLAGRLRQVPVLIITSFRPGEAPAHVRERFGDGTSAAAGGSTASFAPTSLRLGPLAEDAVRRIVRSVAGSDLSGEVLATITGMSEGNPFRALDLVRRARRGEPLGNLPTERAPALWARLRSCSPPEQRLFLACALLERPAPLRLLAAATHLAEAAAFDAAVTLEQRGLIVQRRGGIAPAHDVLADLALEGTGSAGRALLAGWAADALASEPGTSHAELARLYSIAGQPSAAHRHARAAVHDAAASGASDELAALLSLAAETALTEQDRRAVESLRTAFGSGTRRIGGGQDQPFPEAPATAPATPPPNERGAHRPPAHRLRFPVRSLPVAAGVALIAIASAALFIAPGDGIGARGTVLTDSVVVTERIGARDSRSYVVTGPILPAASLVSDRGEDMQPRWIAAMSPPWINPRTSPDGRLVAVERITPGGTSIYVVSADQNNATAIATAPGDNFIGGWSPDSRWLLVIHTVEAAGKYRSSLYAYSAVTPAVRIALDTLSTHFVIDAVWSPLGPHVAWTARTGESRNRTVFVSLSDGTRAQNLSELASEGYHPAWSPDGRSVAFTSDRDGNAELYAREIESGALWRLTFDPAHDDRASYSPDGDFIAFESTRSGRTGVYAMPPLGGTAIRLTPGDRNFSLVGWKGRTPSYVTRLRVALPDALVLGQLVPLAAVGVDQFGASIDVPSVQWTLLDGTAELLPGESEAARDSGAGVLVARRPGLARVVAALGAWRADTVFTVVGSASIAIVNERFTAGVSSSSWISLGEPAPRVLPGAGIDGGKGLVLRSGRKWESGILSTSVIPLRKGVTVSARIRAPFVSTGAPGGFTIALVAAEAPDEIDPSAPQFLKLVALTWLPEAGRLAYSAEREYISETVNSARQDAWHDFRIVIEHDGRVAYYVDRKLRRRSTVAVAGSPDESLVQLWLGGRGAGEDVVVNDVQLWINRAK